MNVYTYFEPCGDIDLEDEVRLLLLWQDNWRAHGFNPVVLNEYHARRHPDFTAYNEAISKLPTVNPKEYERACFLRWLAMAKVGGGLMADYDMFNYGCKWTEISFTGESELVFYEDFSPSCVCMTPKGVTEICEIFAAYVPDALDHEGGKPHTSDQNILGRRRQEFPVKPMVKLYTSPGWETSKLVHYSQGVTVPNGKRPKWQHIPQLRPLELKEP